MAAQSPVPPAAAAAADSSSTDDDFEVEGPQWDAKKVQYGLPTGVKNTYDIDGMEKMNPDEYQAAIRQVWRHALNVPPFAARLAIYRSVFFFKFEPNTAVKPFLERDDLKTCR